MSTSPGATPLAPEQYARFYGGKIVHLTAFEASATLCAYMWQRVQQQVERLPLPEVYAALAPLRETLHQDAHLQALYGTLLAQLGLKKLSHWRVDRPRLRSIVPGAEHNPRARAAYYAHRDTWYGNPVEQINLWLPLQEYTAEQTFRFWPEYFQQAIPNSSEDFHARHWRGFQQANTHYPAPHKPQNLPDHSGFAVRAGDVLLFCGQHLHQTLPNPGPEVRYSLDLRLLFMPDHTARTRCVEPVDNASTGCVCRQYTYLNESGSRERGVHE